jgi:DNA-directed RNA polymerase I and III subunit RPAC2
MEAQTQMLPQNKIEIYVNMSRLGDDFDSEYSRTFVLNHEDHTLANSLRYMIMKNPNVLFCGYTQPHPSEFKINFKIQTNKQQTALEVLEKGLIDLSQVCSHVTDVFENSLKSYYERK